MKRRHGLMIGLMWLLSLAGCGGGGATTGGNGGAGAPMTLFVPLYVWPDLNLPSGAWNRVMAAAAKTPVVAVINPNSGPINPAPQAFVDGVRALRAAGVRVLGYVPSGYGARAAAAVHADMDVYLAQYGVDGIFIDEVETTNPARFAGLCAHQGASWIVLNPGAAFPNAYLSGACTQAVAFEGSENAWWMHALSAENTALPPSALIALVHSGAADLQSLQTSLNQAKSLGIANAYVTDRPFGPQTWNALASYFDSEAAMLGGMRIP